VESGSRIAQMVFVTIARPTFEIVDGFTSSARGDSGFGSTGA